MRTRYRALPTLIVVLLITLGCSSGARLEIPDDGSIVRLVYFYSVDCPHCRTVEGEVLEPLQATFGERLEIRWVETSDPDNYELLIRTEEYFDVGPEERGLPTLVVDGQALVGEEQIREQLTCLLQSCFASGGTTWPDIAGLQEAEGVTSQPLVVLPGIESDIGGTEICEEGEALLCEEPAPVWAAYFYETGCQHCSRAKADMEYVRARYPQLVYDEFNIYHYKDATVARWLAERADREWESFHTPAIFVGDDVLMGGEEITPQNLQALIGKYAPTGADRIWEQFDQEAEAGRLADAFLSLGPLAVVLAGLVDGLNPCAFATIVFFVSYLTLSGRQGREVLLVGGAFTAGVFLAYLAVGLGFYRILDLLGSLLTVLGRWVYGLTALLCAMLAVLSFLDFLKARRGQIGDMALSLPHSLRMRINAIIRRGRGARAYVAGAFVTGLLVSFLELACTGQVYLPTIIAVMSQPGLRARAFFFLVLYNLLFIAPLVVVFILAYYGTTSKELTRFLQRRASIVKLGMVVLFISLAIWLGLSLVIT